jgi:hypothetical protein
MIRQAYTINSLSSAVPFPGAFNQRLAYDQSTIVDFYASFVGVPGCNLAGNDQPFVYRFDAITPNPESLGSWTVSAPPIFPPSPAPSLALASPA